MTAPRFREFSEGVLTITHNLPKSRNPISGKATIDTLCEAVEAADADPDCAGSRS